MDSHRIISISRIVIRALCLASLFLLTLIAGCGGGGGGGGSPVSVLSSGTITGRVSASGNISASIQGFEKPSAQVITGGAGIPNAEIWLQDRPDSIIRADKDGNFTLSDVPLEIPQRVVCRYRQPVTGELFLTRSLPITLTSQAPKYEAGTLPVEKGINLITGTIKDILGKPVSGARLNIWGMDFQTDANGVFRSFPLPASVLSESVRISASGFKTISLPFPFGSGEAPPLFEITLPIAGEENNPPLISLASVSRQVAPSTEVRLQASVFDSDEIDVSLLKPEWETTAGEFSPTGDPSGDPFSKIWVAPSDPGLATVSVRILDSRGAPAKTQFGFVVGGLAQPVVRVNSFSPAFGGPGTVVAIKGNGFGPKSSAGNVVFNGLPGTILSWSDTEIQVTVPPKVTTGLIVLTAMSQERTVGIFSVLDPTLSLSPTFGPPGTTITITGLDFGETQGSATVTINQTNAAITSWSDKTIQAKVPVNTTTGMIVLKIRDQERTAGLFTVTKIHSFAPGQGTIHTDVTVTGEGFGPNTGAAVVVGGGFGATVTEWSDTRILFRIPLGARTGAVTTKVQGLDITLGTISINAVTKLTPIGGKRGQEIIIEGNGFGPGIATSTITFNGFLATPTTWSDTRIVTTVPASATPGNLIVRVNGNESNKVYFRVMNLESVSYLRGPAGTNVTINGFGFGAEIGEVLFASEPASAYNAWTDTQIQAVVPGTASGVATITVETDGVNSIPKTFLVTEVTDVNPLEGWIGREITITGANFGPTADGNQVFLNDLEAPIASWTENQIIARIPVGAASGPLYLRFSGFSMDIGEFDVRPIEKYAMVGTAWSGPRAESSPAIPGVVVDSAGNTYLADIDNDWIWKYDASGTFVTRLGNTGSGPYDLDGPWGLAVDSSDNIYISDTNNHRIQTIDKTGTFLGWYGRETGGTKGFFSVSSGKFPAKGTGNGEFDFPTGVFVDSSGNIYVSEVNNNRVQKFDSFWTYQLQMGPGGSAVGQFNAPHGLCVDGSGNIYVADTQNHRIQMFSGAGVFQKWYGLDNSNATGSHVLGTSKEGTMAGAFKNPYDVKLDSLGRMVITEAGNGRIQIMKTDGVSVDTIGQAGGGLGQYSGNYSLALFGSTIYIADSLNHRVQLVGLDKVFQKAIVPDTGALTSLPVRLAVDTLREIVYVLDENDSSIMKFSLGGTFLGRWGTKGSQKGQLNFPSGITLDGKGNIYVADSGNARIQVFDPQMNFLKQWGSFGVGDGQFNNPIQVAVNDAGTEVFVADRDNHRVQKFTTSGTLIGWWGADTLSFVGWHSAGSGRFPDFGPAPGKFNEPLDVAVDEEGSVYVITLNNNDLQKFGGDQTQGANGNYRAIINSTVGFWGLCVDSTGALYVSNDENQIEKYLPDLQ